MEEIINKFEKLATNNDGIDDLITKISNITIEDPDLEWSKLQKNYSILKHFKNISRNVDKKHYDAIFKKPFTAFMEKIDQLNQYYLKNVNLDPESYTETGDYNLHDISSLRDIIKIIGASLDKSMNSNNPINKLDYVLIAYSNIILLIQDFHGDKHIKLNDSADFSFYETNQKRRKH